MSKTSTAFDTFDTAYQPLRIPAHSRLLRCTELVGNLQGGSVPALPSSEEVAPKRVKLTGLSSDDFKMEAAFGLPWSEVDFISKACLHGHPRDFCNQIPKELVEAVSRHVEWNDAQLSKYRIDYLEPKGLC